MGTMPVAAASRVRCCGAAVLLVTVLVGCASAPGPIPPVAAPEPPRHQQWSDAIIYFVITDRFADGEATNNVAVDRTAKGTFHGGDLAGLTRHLDEIADLGVTALWITPVVDNVDDFVTGAGFPDWAYHGYWADDFTRLDPRFGSAEDLAALVAACHRRGIAVLLDVVYNHPGYGSRYLRDPATRDWLRSDEQGDCGSDDLTSCLSGLPDFKTELEPVADHLLDAQLAHARAAGVDGFRLDTVKHVDHPFWQEHRRRTRAELGAGFFLLGEVWGGDPDVLDPWFAPDEMDAGFDFGFAGSTLAWLGGRGRTVAFSRYLEKRHRTRPGYQLAHYLSSHDVPTALWQLEGDTAALRLAAVLQLTSVGIPVIFYGEEVGRLGGEWPDNRSDMPWGDREVLPGQGLPRDEALRADYRRLVAIRRAHPALSRGAYTAVASDGDLLAFSRREEGSSDLVVIAVNRGAEPAAVELPLPDDWRERRVVDEWRSAEVTASATALRVVVPAREACILAATPPRSEE